MPNTSQNQKIVSKEGNFLSPVGFKSGMSSSVTSILALIRALSEVSSLKNNLFMKQVEAESHMVNAFSEGQKELGQLQFQEALGEGIASMVSGSLQLVMSVGASALESKSLNELQKEVNSSNEFELNPQVEGMITEGENIPSGLSTESKTAAENLIRKVDTGEFEFSKGFNEEEQELVSKIQGTDQFNTLEEAIKSRKEKLKETYESETKSTYNRTQTLNNAAQALGSATSGAGRTYGATQKAAQGQQNADNTQEQAAQQEFGKMADETQNQADKAIAAANDLTQAIINIDRSNKAILSA